MDAERSLHDEFGFTTTHLQSTIRSEGQQSKPEQTQSLKGIVAKMENKVKK